MRPQFRQGWRKFAAILCLISFQAASVGHVAHVVERIDNVASSGNVLLAAPASVCPICAALQSSAAETEFSSSVHKATISSCPASTYQSRLSTGDFQPIFVRPPPAV